MVVLLYYATEGPRIMYYTVLLLIMYLLCIMYYATLLSTCRVTAQVYPGIDIDGEEMRCCGTLGAVDG